MALWVPTRLRPVPWAGVSLISAAVMVQVLSAAPARPDPKNATRPAAAMTRAADPPLPVDKRQEAALLQLVGGEFKLRSTPHFLLAYNTNPDLVNDLAARLEETYRAVYRFAGVVGIPATKPKQRLEVVFFNRREQYEEYAATLRFPARGTYGVYYEPTNRSAFFNVYNDPPLLELHAQIGEARRNLADLTGVLKQMRGNQPIILSYGDGRQERLTKTQARRKLEDAQRELRALDGKRTNYSERINQTIVQHEAAHQVLFNAGVHVRRGSNPKWIVEGLACLFETPPSEWGSGIAATNQLRLKDLRAAMVGESGKRLLHADDFVSAVRDGRLLSPERLVSDPSIFGQRDERGANVYAMAWSLTHYLQRRQPRQLAAYLQEIAARRPGREFGPVEETELFEKHFGPINDAFLRQWGGHVAQLAYRPPIGF